MITRVRWLRHADHPEWGYLNLEAMVVFSSDEDRNRWTLKQNPVGIWDIGDRDSSGFGVLAGNNYGFDPEAAYVLIPEVISP